MLRRSWLLLKGKAFPKNAAVAKAPDDNAASSSPSAQPSVAAAVAAAKKKQNYSVTDDAIVDFAAKELKTKREIASYLAGQLRDEATVPFLARYRRPQTGNMSEEELSNAYRTLKEAKQLFEVRNRCLAELEKRNLLSDKLGAQFLACTTLGAVEALFLPYKEVRKTAAEKAREADLEPLATAILEGKSKALPSALKAKLDGLDEAGCTLVSALLSEAMFMDGDLRNRMATLVLKEGRISSSLVTDKSRKKKTRDLPDASWERLVETFKTYDGFNASVFFLRHYQTLALNRGSAKGVLSISIEVDGDLVSNVLQRHLNKTFPHLGANALSSLVGNEKRIVTDAVDRLMTRQLLPYAKRAVQTKQRREAEVAGVASFRKNFSALLMQRPLVPQRLLAIDPGFVKGCKVVVLEPTGAIREATIFFGSKPDEAQRIVKRLLVSHGIDKVVIGNGTGAFDAAKIVSDVAQSDPQLLKTTVCITPETGASIYSTSKAAQEELGHLDVLHRSAANIGRRVQEPLSEYVKMAPETLGVGLYQYDMPPKALKESLTEEVESVVAKVGLDVNVASVHLLRAVPGMTASAAQRIVDHRQVRAGFTSRAAVEEAIGDPKVFANVAGFIRVPTSSHPFDNTVVHPESYNLLDRLLKECGLDRFRLGDLDAAIRTRIEACAKKRDQAPATGSAEALGNLAEKLGVNTSDLVQLILLATTKIRDPRADLPFAGLFREKYRKFEDVKVGTVLNGRVGNVAPFGAFVDLGLETDVLVHCSNVRLPDGRELKSNEAPSHFYPSQLVKCVVIATGETERDFKVGVDLGATVELSVTAQDQDEVPSDVMRAILRDWAERIRGNAVRAMQSNMTESTKGSTSHMDHADDSPTATESSFDEGFSTAPRTESKKKGSAAASKARMLERQPAEKTEASSAETVSILAEFFPESDREAMKSRIADVSEPAKKKVAQLNKKKPSVQPVKSDGKAAAAKKSKKASKKVVAPKAKAASINLAEFFPEADRDAMAARIAKVV